MNQPAPHAPAELAGTGLRGHLEHQRRGVRPLVKVAFALYVLAAAGVAVLVAIDAALELAPLFK